MFSPDTSFIQNSTPGGGQRPPPPSLVQPDFDARRGDGPPPPPLPSISMPEQGRPLLHQAETLTISVWIAPQHISQMVSSPICDVKRCKNDILLWNTLRVVASSLFPPFSSPTNPPPRLNILLPSLPPAGRSLIQL